MLAGPERSASRGARVPADSRRGRPNGGIVRGAQNMVRIGILGAGSVVELYHLPVLRNVAGASIVWLCDTDEARARRLRRVCRGAGAYTRIEECPDVDVVLVAIPVGYRRDPLRHVFSSGWHALCEKPFAV